MVLTITRRAQGVAGEVSGLLGQFVKGSLQVVELLPLAPRFLPVEALSLPVFFFQCVDEEGVFAPRQVLRSDSTASPYRSVEVGSAVAIDEPHCTTFRALPRLATSSV
jgi:hypothetical protein